MPRPPRPQLAGGVYHVTSRGVRGSAIFISDADRELFTALLRRVARRRHWNVLLYCLMTNHFHLVVETPEPDLSRGIQYLKGVYAQAFNEIHAFTGALYERRFWCGLIESDEADRRLRVRRRESGLRGAVRPARGLVVDGRGVRTATARARRGAARGVADVRLVVEADTARV